MKTRSFLVTTLIIVFLSLFGSLPLFRGQATAKSSAGVIESTGSVDQQVRTIQFAGRSWLVKNGCGLGPGPNCWSDSEESVWIENGELHLKLRKINDQWYSAEVVSQDCTQYGMHRFFVVGRPDLLDQNVVNGLFLYRADDSEITIEFARFGNASNADNALYIIQPSPAHPFHVDLNGEFSTHEIDWQANSVNFRSMHGHYVAPPTISHVIEEWGYSGANIPQQEECLRVHVNLWSFGGNPPANNEEVEIVLSNANLPDSYRPPIFLPFISAKPGLVITEASEEMVSGRVIPDDETVICSEGYHIELYSKIDIWYRSKSQDIAINPDCTWQSSAQPWDQLAAFLVKSAYDAPSIVNSIQPCPPPPLEVRESADILTYTCYEQ